MQALWLFIKCIFQLAQSLLHFITVTKNSNSRCFFDNNSDRNSWKKLMTASASLALRSSCHRTKNLQNAPFWVAAVRAVQWDLRSTPKPINSSSFFYVRRYISQSLTSWVRQQKNTYLYTHCFHMMERRGKDRYRDRFFFRKAFFLPDIF